MHKIIYRMSYTLCCTLCCFLSWIFLPAFAGDLSSEIRKGTSGPDSTDGGYIELGSGLESYTNPIFGMPEGNSKGEVHTGVYLDINARYQYKGFFAELFSQGLEQFTLGYNFYNTDQYSVDWVGLVQHQQMTSSVSDDYDGLNKRYFDFMSGPRATAYFGNSILQLHVLTDISDTHHGYLYSLKLARHWQYRNWTFHGILGATYRSQKVMDYYFSIDETEASENFAVYQAPSMMAYIGEIGVTYPLSEKWVFRSFIRRINIEKDSTQSPLILDDHGEVFATSISYVF